MASSNKDSLITVFESAPGNGSAQWVLGMTADVQKEMSGSVWELLRHRQTTNHQLEIKAIFGFLCLVHQQVFFPRFFYHRFCISKAKQVFILNKMLIQVKNSFVNGKEYKRAKQL